MRKLIAAFTLLVAFWAISVMPASANGIVDATSTNSFTVQTSGGLVTIHHFDHYSQQWEVNGVNICMSPGNRVTASDFQNCGIMLVFEDRNDICSSGVAAGAIGPQTIVLAPAEAWSGCLARLSQVGTRLLVRPGNSFSELGIGIEVVDARNIPGSGNTAHLEGCCVGYLLTIGNTRFYIPGVTDITPEFRGAAQRAQVVLLPIDPPYSMSMAQTAAALDVLQGKILIPVHTGDQDISPFIATASQYAMLVEFKLYPDGIGFKERFARAVVSAFSSNN